MEHDRVSKLFSQTMVELLKKHYSTWTKKVNIVIFLANARVPKVEHTFHPAMISIGGSDVFQRLKVALVVVIGHETGNLSLQLSGKKIIRQVHDMLHRTVVAFDLTLGRRMVGRAAGVLDLLTFEKECGG
jgi:hypothetical protein